MKPIKCQLALGTAIVLLTIVGIETIAVAVPHIMPGNVITNNDCGGDKDDEC
ncbi:MAG: hypothetical protein ACTMUB_02060 [cyanobacterium endosymbiont of Rhopalodia musculus]|uniref:hypothetical protein n=1 Tax=cyanobacterium endosymbiont of Epithemia clementina EcSB TaxID=3034674 RepID=UPI00247FE6FA|nr:hypothetical protein [cyanobacterium endosymbiont of Epithemia clementina EcSB]WGT67017.1 hypothetical protein P3F56_07230 [cyanobacterium endosymbiont of Epithemia clementina EcSB]